MLACESLFNLVDTREPSDLDQADNFVVLGELVVKAEMLDSPFPGK
jgi:hypothetical protein